MKEEICSKFIIIKAGSRIVTISPECEVCEYELLDDLQAQVECTDQYAVEKILVLPNKSGTEID